jgi:hypothetical protein
MTESNETIYVRLIEGVSVLVPVKAKPLGGETYLITENDLLDLENDATSIWEFFPGDVVRCTVEGNLVAAKELLESDFANRQLYTLLFRIVESIGKLSQKEKIEFREAIEELCKRRSAITQSRHPIVDQWLENNC